MIYDVLVSGAGPAGLSAAVVCAGAGASVLVVDENAAPGGQLFKQIHKFFGSGEHYAGMRGIDIGNRLLSQAERYGVEIRLNARAVGMMDDGSVGIYRKDGPLSFVQFRKLILATGARENAASFPGWTLPGVMTAGAAQTFANIHHVLPGRKVLTVGGGNIGLIVSYHLMQAGAQVAAITDILPRVKGYAVHAGKLSRAGVPFYLSHQVLEARGDERVREAVIREIGPGGQPVPGSEKTFEVDCVILAVGLSPRTELAGMCGCRTAFHPALGGYVPVHNGNMETGVPGVFVCGDLAGVEEASTALEEGRLAGTAAAASLGYMDAEKARRMAEQIGTRLDNLRGGPFGQVRLEEKRAILLQAEGEDASCPM
jgi:NADPH-dependent 2,4-dienoyl-CoA reductase/sulfur reductase-like enzyme